MKIIGQSTVADGAPYIHLGYIAATHPEPKSPLFGGGLVLLIVGVAMGFPLVFGKNKAGWTTLHFVRRKNPTLVRTGIAMAVIGSVGIVLSVVYGKRAYDRPETITWLRAEDILGYIDRSADEGKPVPADITAFKVATTGMVRFKGDSIDGWRREMRLVKEIGDGKEVTFVVSAGRDGEFSTSDDLRYSLEKYREKRRSLSATSRPAATQPAQ